MDDLIVIILSLIFIVASIFGQKKKKPVPRQPGQIPVPPPTQQPGNDNFWDMLENEYRRVTLPEETPEAVEEMPEPSWEPQNYAFNPDTEGSRISEAVSETDIKPRIITEKKRFPLRKAVIYSEILNRKYF